MRIQNRLHLQKSKRYSRLANPPFFKHSSTKNLEKSRFSKSKQCNNMVSWQNWPVTGEVTHLFLYFSLELEVQHWRHCTMAVRENCKSQVGCPRNSADTEFRGIFWLLKWFLRNSGEIPRNSAEFRGILPELHRKSLPYSAECQNVTSVDTLISRTQREGVSIRQRSKSWRY